MLILKDLNLKLKHYVVKLFLFNILQFFNFYGPIFNFYDFFRYKRIFSVGTMGISTYNPNKLEVTNQVLFY